MNIQRTISTLAAVLFIGGSSAGPAFSHVTYDAQGHHVQVAAQQSQPDPFEDDHTQTTVRGVQVHVCRSGALLVGVDADNNRFLCSHASHLGDAMTFAVDTSTHETFDWGNGPHRVHICPGNSMMVGWAQDRNWLICTGQTGTSSLFRFTTGVNGNVVIDGPGGTQHQEPRHSNRSLHSCNGDGASMTMAMKGIDAANNVFICANVTSNRLFR